MILVDANVIIGYLKRPDPKVLGLFQSHQAAVCGITRAEVLHGARNPADRQRLLLQLNALAQVTIPPSIWDTVGDVLAALRAVGVTVPFPDVVLACVAVEYGLQLWTRDQHFALMQPVLPQLILFQEPP
ncbi:MAG TPA: PIN domain-containing protein [Gemmataceae bacterium]|nr:PIN domain-containing protein [Gemmataceae bacterium]